MVSGYFINYNKEEMMRTLVILFMAVVGLLAAGCNSISEELPLSRPQSVINYNRGDVTVKPAVSGQCTKKWYCFGLVQKLDEHYIILGFSGYEVQKSNGISILDEVIQRAHYKALQKAPDSDYLIYPRFTVSEGGFFPFYFRRTATVSGKPVIIKPDVALKR